MKKLLFLLIVSCSIAFAQAPQYISHRGTVYNTNGTIVASTLVKIKISILENSSTGTPVYTETHTITTNPKGEYSLNIGNGTAILGTFPTINWGNTSTKFLKVEIDPTGGGMNYPIVGSNQLMSVPYALFSQNTNASNILRLVNNISELKAIVGNPGDVIYIKGHTTPGDGGGGNFIWRTDANLRTSTSMPAPPHSVDNNGTIIQAVINNVPNDNGRWVRQFDGFIDVRFFGAFGGFCTSKVQAAINFAALNANVLNPPTSGTTIFFPNGGYIIDKLILKNGITLLGDSFDKTIIYSTMPGDIDYNVGNVAPYTDNYLFEIENGPVQISMTNFNIVSRDTTTNRGCFYFNAKTNGTNGGLWHSTFKNIKINFFRGHGIYLKGGSNPNLNIPNQFLTFENLQVTRVTDNTNALRMTGQNGQMTFINCQLDGYKTGETAPRPKLANVQISHDGSTSAAVISFINCSFQDADYGLSVDYAENITIDNCWFESLGVGINIDGTYLPCKGINIVNNRFANAAGFGCLTTHSSNLVTGMCVALIKSSANIANNYVTTSCTSAPTEVNFFVYASNPEGVTLSGNTFHDYPELGKTVGLVPNITASSTLTCNSNKTVIVSGSPLINIKTITSDIGAGETLFVRANGTIKFDNLTSTGNIFLTNKTTLTLNNGEVAVFTKIDIAPSFVIYQLTSIIRGSTP